MSTRIIGLVDCDSFFASCERVFRPDWEGRPVVVLSNNDGCVVARSSEAKALQIPMGEPYFKLKKFAESRGVVVRSANYSLYGDLSRRVLQTLAQWSPLIDAYSIDEAFLDLSSRFCDADGKYRGFAEETRSNLALGDVPLKTRRELEELAAEIVETVKRWTGVPVSLGLGPTRTLAKAASRLAKDESQVSGRKYALLFNREERVSGLKRLSIDKVWGVGRKLTATFQKSGLKTAFDLAKLDPVFMRRSFSIVQERLVRELRGEQTYDVASRPEPQRSLQISRSFGETLETLDELEKPAATFASEAAAKLRARRLVAVGLSVYITTNRHNENAPQYYSCASSNFSKPTNSTPEILTTALRLLRQLYKPGYAYKKAGVVAFETCKEETANERRYLFEPDPTRPQEIRERDKRLCAGLDQLNARFGKGAVFFGAEGVEREWRPNANFVSPCYTTDWDSLPRAS